MAVTEDLLVQLKIDASGIVKGARVASRSLKDMGKQSKGLAASFEKMNDKIRKLAAPIITLNQSLELLSKGYRGLAFAVENTIGVFADFETALVGVQKTTDIQGDALQNFGQSLSNLSEEIPITTNELLNIAQAAGQLGVRGVDNLENFTETISKISVATDLTSNAAATAFTRILTVTGEGVEGIGKFASVIVELGNNFAATESEITRVATEVARSTAVFEPASRQVLAIATALKQLGVQAQLGGSAIGRTFREIDVIIRDKGSPVFELLERLTSMTGDALRKTFAEDSVKVFAAFIKGLNKVQNAGGDVAKVLAEFNLKGDEISKVIPVIAKRADVLAATLKTANKAFKENTALSIEAKRAFDTLNATFILFRNTVRNVAKDIGKSLEPSITSMLKAITQFVKDTRVFISTIREIDFSRFIEGLKKTAIAVAITLAAFKIGQLLLFIRVLDLQLGKVLLQTIVNFKAWRIAQLANLKVMIKSLVPIGIMAAKFLAIVVAIAGAVVAIDLIIRNFNKLATIIGGSVIVVFESLILAMEAFALGLAEIIVGPMRLVAGTFVDVGGKVKEFVDEFDDKRAKALGKQLDAVKETAGDVGLAFDDLIENADLGVINDAIELTTETMDLFSDKTKEAAEETKKLTKEVIKQKKEMLDVSDLIGAREKAAKAAKEAAKSAAAAQSLASRLQIESLRTLEEIQAENRKLSQDLALFGLEGLELLRKQLDIRLANIDLRRQELEDAKKLTPELEKALEIQKELVRQQFKQQKPTTVGDVAGSISAAIDLDNLDAAFALVEDAFENPVENLKAAGESIKQAAIDAGNAIKAAIADITLEDIGSAIMSAVQDVADLMSGILSGEFVNQLSSSLQFIGDLPQQMSDAFINLDEVMNNFITQFPQMVNRLVLEFPKIIDSIIQAIPLVIQALTDNLPAMAKSLLDGIVRALPVIAKGIGEMLPVIFTELSKAIGPLISAVISALPDILSGIMKAITDAIPLLVDSILMIIDSIVDILPQLIETFAEMLPAVVEQLAEALPRIAIALVEAIIDLFLSGGAVRIILALVKAIPRLIIALVKGIVIGLIKGLSGAFDNVVGKIATGAKNAALQFTDGVKRLADQGTKVSKQLFGVLDLEQAARGKSQVLDSKKIIKNIKKAAKDAAKILTNALDVTKAIAAILAAILLWQGAVALAGAAWAAAVAAAGAVWETIVAVAGAVWEVIVAAAGVVWETIVAVAGAVWEAIVAAAGVVWETIVAVAGAVWDAIVVASGVVWDGIVVASGVVWDAIVVASGVVWDGIVVASGVVWDAIVVAAGAVWTVAVEAAAVVWNLIIAGGTALWAAIVLATSTTAGILLTGGLILLLAAFVVFFEDIRVFFEGLGGKISEAWKSAVSFFSDISFPDIKIPGLEEFKNLIGQFAKLNPFGGGGGGGDGGVLGKITSGISGLFGNTGGLVTAQGIQHFQGGGIVNGSGLGDTVPSMLTPGEFVLNRSAVSNVGTNLLSSMNKGQVPVSQNFNISLNIENKGSDLDEQFIRTRVIPATLDAIKRASIDGKFTIANKGIRQL